MFYIIAKGNFAYCKELIIFKGTKSECEWHLKYNVHNPESCYIEEQKHV